jgi:hypothetical protein
MIVLKNMDQLRKHMFWIKKHTKIKETIEKHKATFIVQQFRGSGGRFERSGGRFEQSGVEFWDCCPIHRGTLSGAGKVSAEWCRVVQSFGTIVPFIGVL